MVAAANLREIIRAYLASEGISATELSRRVGKNETLVKAILSGRTTHPRTDTLIKLAAAMRKDPAILLDALPRDGQSPPPPADFQISRQGSTVRDLPVYGAAEGGDGVMVLGNEPIEYMERPAELQGVKTAYAIYVVGDSMYPAYEPGDRAYIHPGRPLMAGKDALFESHAEDGTRHAMIKRLVKVTEKAWRVQQFNPPKVFELPKAKWQKVSRVVGSYRD